jgi:hypothetical protein
MTYTDRQFGTELLAELDAGYDPIRIAKWAYVIFLDADRRDRTRRVEGTLIELFTMEEGLEFHITEAELRARAQRLISAG